MARRSGHQITLRDRQILAWIGTHGMVTADQVARRFFAREDGAVGKRAAQRRLAVLEKLALVRRNATPFWRAPWVIRVTQAGADMGEISIRPARMVEGEVRHALALVDLVEELARFNRGCTLRTEREIRTDRWHQRQDGRLRPGKGRTPDGELTLRDGRVVAIELDLTPKRSKDFERILRAYRQERFDVVWWYVLPGALARVAKLVADNRVDDFIEVRPWRPVDQALSP
ncbi:MAG TPA: replication-relaxation family protein [Chloroflexota bacterium]|nr:replication-relaxation family protein [Chloroflexota bacterium]